MLRGDHSIVLFDSGKAQPDRLTRVRHGHYLHYATRMLAAYRNGIGMTRRELHKSVEQILSNEPDCDRRRIAAFSRLLDDAGEFADDARGAAAELRLRVFSIAAKYHPLVDVADKIFERGETEVKQIIATELGRPWTDIEPALYVDVIDYQPLVSFAGYPNEAALLSRYNVAQLQACLYKADALTIYIRNDFKSVVRYAKLSRLLLDVHRTDVDEYRIDLSGPASVLHETRRYGVNFARFIPALLACRDWKLRATLRTPWGTPAVLNLTSEDGYTSHLPPSGEFDSSLEESFAENFGASPREGWQLIREGIILHEGQTTFIPDFAFRHETGVEVLLEVVGFWTPEYLEKKRETLQKFRRHQIVLAVAERSLRTGRVVPTGVIVFKTALKVEPVLEALRARAAQ